MAQAIAIGNAGNTLATADAHRTRRTRGNRECPEAAHFILKARLAKICVRNSLWHEGFDKNAAGKNQMLAMIARLFMIKTRPEAFMVIYALAVGAAERGRVYLDVFPGFGGKLLFAACMGTVAMAGAKILDCIKYEKQFRKMDAPAGD